MLRPPEAELRVLWLQARPTVNQRLGPDRVVAYPADVYTKFVCEELLAAKCVPEPEQDTVHINAKCKAWLDAFDHLGHSVLGLALCKPNVQSSLMVYLGRQQRHLMDYWATTPYRIFHACLSKSWRQWFSGSHRKSTWALQEPQPKASSTSSHHGPLMLAGPRLAGPPRVRTSLSLRPTKLSTMCFRHGGNCTMAARTSLVSIPWM